MAALNRGVSTGTTVSTSNPVVSPSNGPVLTAQSYLLVAVACSVNLAVTSIAVGTGSGSFVHLGATNNGTIRLELWLGYNFAGNPVTYSVTRAAGTAVMDVIGRVIDITGDAKTLPTFTVSTATGGTSTTATAGPVTPAVGDILFPAITIASNTADSMARASSGNTYLDNIGVEQSTTRHEMSWTEATAATPSDLTWTLAASVPWIGLQAKITPAAPATPSPAFLLKGHTTYALDASSVY